MEHIEHSELSVYWLDTYNVLDIQRFRCCALVGHSDLKKCYFVWHLKRFGVLLGWTCTSLRQICAFGLDTCKSFGPKGSLLVQLILYHKFNCLFYTVLLLKHTVFVYNVAEQNTHLCIFHEYVTTSLYIHWCHIVGNPKQIWNFWQLANKLKFSCSPWIMHALFQLDASHFCEENPTNHVYTDYCMHASEIIFVLIYP